MMLQVMIHLFQLAQRDFIALKVKVDKLGINILLNPRNGLKKCQEKVDNLDVGKLKTVLVEREHKIQQTKYKGK